MAAHRPSAARLSRRGFLGALPAPYLNLARAGRPPNVLVFMTDQESALLPGPVKLPARQRIIESGVRFRSAFCSTPQCSPARAALQTGLYPHLAGVVTNVDGSSLGKPLNARVPTVGTVFQSAGYQTAYFGKWHLGGEEEGPAQFGYSYVHSGEDEEVARQAAAWIVEQREPWLAWVSVLDPHHIYDNRRHLAELRLREGARPPRSGLENLRSKPSEQMAYVEQDQGKQTRDFSTEHWLRYRSFYCELVEKTDICLWLVLGAVRDWDSTIIAYTSDHGDALGEHGLPYKGPFMYEELIRIPLIIHGPGVFSRPRERDDLVTQVDLPKTLASLAGLRWPRPVAGRDLAKDTRGPDAVFLEYYAKQKWVNPIRTIRTRRWKLNLYDRGNREMYDLESDPHELVNLAGDRRTRQIEGSLEKRLDQWRKPMFTPEPPA